MGVVGTVLFQTEKHLLYFMKREQEKEREAERRKAVWKILLTKVSLPDYP